MPPRKRAQAPALAPAEEFYEWDALVEETRVKNKPFQLRVPVLDPEEGGDTHELLTIPVPSGAAYIQLSSAQARGDAAGILVNLSDSGENDEENAALFNRLMGLMAKADFPIVDRLAAQVVMHYFAPAPKAADGGDGGPGESSAS